MRRLDRLMSPRSRIQTLPRRPRLLSPEAGHLTPLLDGFLTGLPELSGSPIRISTLPQLTASRGRLLSGSPDCGYAVHAASFLPGRHIVIESGLPRYRRLFRFVLLHEIFHFVWVRLGNVKRAEFNLLLEREFAAGARGARRIGPSEKGEISPPRYEGLARLCLRELL